ncbi:hypothetical protein CK203_104021 [Vitis vinifera]|uniref:Uncharacterized protein n=1 Tax=Vitis vinifera TaxID=29760 RepID=A0A438FFQ5_VITVI|nr:hypothetical protein CK203_104021 [Vitis vinifera]
MSSTSLLMDAMVSLELDTLYRPCIFHMSLKELPPRMLLVDVVLRSNIFPFSIWCRGEELYWRLYSGYQRVFYFGPHHLIMISLSTLKRMSTGRSSREQMPFHYFFPGCSARYYSIWAILMSLNLSTTAFSEKLFTLDKWNHLTAYVAPPGA